MQWKINSVHEHRRDWNRPCALPHPTHFSTCQSQPKHYWSFPRAPKDTHQSPIAGLLQYLNTSITVKHGVLKIALSKPFPASCWAKLSPGPWSSSGGLRYDKAAIKPGSLWLVMTARSSLAPPVRETQQTQRQMRADGTMGGWMERTQPMDTAATLPKDWGRLMKGCNQVAQASPPTPSGSLMPKCFSYDREATETMEVLKSRCSKKELEHCWICWTFKKKSHCCVQETG